MSTRRVGEGPIAPIIVQTAAAPRASNEARADPGVKAGVQSGARSSPEAEARVVVQTGVEPRVGDGARADLEAIAGRGARAGVRAAVRPRIGDGARAVIAVEPNQGPDLDPEIGAEEEVVGEDMAAVRAAAGAALAATLHPTCTEKLESSKSWTSPDAGRSWRSS